eukprot:TRINITY_DN3632_c0_g1_i2.p1 TRINITY_DN3632_c0_g1~~TRINITY_DN3632_c0_g1_i2.p1  ORF type:complete len:167 (+),score=21.38 TRINITY_DN3632_c0_g1_i2:297-797(+)
MNNRATSSAANQQLMLMSPNLDYKDKKFIHFILRECTKHCSKETRKIGSLEEFLRNTKLESKRTRLFLKLFLVELEGKKREPMDYLLERNLRYILKYCDHTRYQKAIAEVFNIPPTLPVVEIDSRNHLQLPSSVQADIDINRHISSLTSDRFILFVDSKQEKKSKG